MRYFLLYLYFVFMSFLGKCLLMIFKRKYYVDYSILKGKIEKVLKSSKYKNLSNPQILKSMLICGEDHRYYYHCGFDLIGLTRAICKNFIYKTREGGSTIEMQMLRVVLNEYQRTYRSKFKEIILSIMIDEELEKEEILNLYLCIAYFGWRMSGVAQAISRIGYNYVNLSLDQAVEVISRLKYPEPKQMSLKRFNQIKKRNIYLIKKYLTLIERGGYFEPVQVKREGQKGCRAIS